LENANFVEEEEKEEETETSRFGSMDLVNKLISESQNLEEF
jgi:hypothetical protein